MPVRFKEPSQLMTFDRWVPEGVVVSLQLNSGFVGCESACRSFQDVFSCALGPMFHDGAPYGIPQKHRHQLSHEERLLSLKDST